MGDGNGIGVKVERRQGADKGLNLSRNSGSEDGNLCLLKARLMSRPALPELLIIRHGETHWNLAGRWQGDLDSPLTDRGVAQGRLMGRFLRDLGVTGASHQIFTSPMGRARKTARLVLEALTQVDGAPVEDARLREISVGDWTGLTRAEILSKCDLSPDAPFLDFYRAAPGAEQLAAMADRCARFLADLTRPSVIVTHGVTSHMLRCLALGWSLDRLDDLPGGQGVIYRVADGGHEALVP